jgi:plastocyanin
LRRYFDVILTIIFFLPIYFPSPALAGTITGTVNVKGLRSPTDILVYVAKAPSGSVDLSGAKFIMDQRNLEFIPHILPVLVGSIVHFPNNDKVDHNIFSMSRTKTFNLGSYKPGESKTVMFDKPGIVELRCDVHAEMAAYILVLENPFFALTDEKGRFQIPDSNYLKQTGLEGVEDLPAGTYSLKTWHEKLKSEKNSVTVSEKGENAIQFNLTRGVAGALYK